MANSLHHPKWSKQRESVDLQGYVTIVGHATPASGTFTLVQGGEAVASVARTGVGAYRLTLREKYYFLLGSHFSIYPHGGAARAVRPGAVSIANKTVDFVVVDGALAAIDTPADETDTVYFQVTFKNSSVAN